MDFVSQLGDVSTSNKSQIPEDAPIEILLNDLLTSIEVVLEEDTWISSHGDVAILLDQICLDLQHWNQDIQNHKSKTLEQIEKKGGALATSIRISLLGILSDFDQLQRSFATVNRDRLPEEAKSLRKQLQLSVNCLTVQVDPILAFISASNEEGSIHKVRRMLIAWEKEYIDTLHHDVKPSLEKQPHATTNISENTSMLHPLENLVEANDFRSPSTSSVGNRRVTLRQASPDLALGLETVEQSVIAKGQLPTTLTATSTVPLARFFALVIKGFNDVEAKFSIEKEHPSMRIRIQIECHRLMRCAAILGLTERNSRINNTYENLIRDILSLTNSVLKDIFAIPSKYSLQKSGQDSKFPSKSIVWALDDKRALQKCIGSLIKLNDDLGSLVPVEHHNGLQNLTDQTYLSMLQQRDSVEELKVLYLAAHLDMPLNSASGDPMSETSTLIDENDFEPLVTGNQSPTTLDKLIFLKIQLSSPSQHRRASTLLDLAQVCIYDRSVLGSSDRFNFAKIEDKSALIEWMWCSDEPIRPGLEMERIGKLAAMLNVEDKPTEFRVPHSLGYFMDPTSNQMAIVWEMPDEAKDSIPCSLFQLLNSSNHLLASRFQLAQYLATTVGYLHSMNLVHKSLRSENIIFLQTTKNENEPDILEPYIIGFGQGRSRELNDDILEHPQHREQNVYRHPYYQHISSRHFRKIVDIYALGLILIEIGYWRPIKKWNIEKLAGASLSVSEIPKSVMRRALSLLDGLRYTMGERYHNAVKACIVGPEAFGLDSEADEDDPSTQSLLLQSYFRCVVDELNKISV